MPVQRIIGSPPATTVASTPLNDPCLAVLADASGLAARTGVGARLRTLAGGGVPA